MRSRTTVERWLKSTTSRDYVELERHTRLAGGAISSEISDDETNWMLTTVWSSEGGDESDTEEEGGDDEPY